MSIQKYNNNFKNQIAFSKLAKSGLLYHLNSNDNYIDKLLDIAIKCKTDYKEKAENQTEYIFKMFCLYGNMTDCISKTLLSNTLISDTLFYKQSKDIDITLLAKTLYYISGTKYKGFLEWQINVILDHGQIDIKEEYIRFLQQCDNGRSIEEIENCIKDISF